MSIEGLQAILDKDEIVATHQAEDLIAHPDLVEGSYRHHVRTYVPFSHNIPGRDGQSVPAFEKKVIRDIKDAKVVRGYITAEYGHGKTSTALYLWDRARQNNLLAVPPFKFNYLPDLARATYGWARYEIGRTRPGSPLLDKVKDAFTRFIDHSAEAYCNKYDIPLATAQRLIRDKPEIIELGANDYIAFFETITDLAQEAGYNGVLILADEMQQYIDPQVKAGTKDPIAPFFDVINSLITRQGRLAIGLLVVIPPRELDVLREQRGDVIHRLLQASLDLRTVYDQDFPQRLWYSLAEEHDFQEHRDRILSPETLRALGQIGGRDDLSDGPRTIVNTFRHATRLYQEQGYPADNPYTPESLVNDLLAGNISYDSSKRIPTVTARALDHSLIKGRPDHERAIKWAAAFPNEGVTRDIQEYFGLAAALDELAQSGLGDLILSVGDVRDRGFTLVGLEAKPVSTDVLSVTMRQFGRDYIDTSDMARKRALRGFMRLLRRKAFPENQWKVISERQGRLTQDTSLILQGAFINSRSNYPERTIQVRILWEDEPVKDVDTEGDALIEIRLKRHLALPENERRTREEILQIDTNGHALRLSLNLMGQTIEISPNLEQRLGAFVSPYKLTPQLLLNLYDVLDDKLQSSTLTRADREEFEHILQPDLLDNAFRQLFNETVGHPVEAAQERLLEIALLSLLEAIYPDYHPLMIIPSWRNSLQKYENALQLLDSRFQRQGQTDVEGTKDDIAKLFAQTNTSLDSFARNFPTLIDGVAQLPGKKKGNVRFSLHPLEQAITKWLANSPTTQSVKVGDQAATIRTLPKQEVYDRAHSLGYQEEEIDALVSLLVLRNLVEEDSRLGRLRQAVKIAPSVDELETGVNASLDEIAMLLSAFPNDSILRDWQSTLTNTKERLGDLRKQPDDKALDGIERGLKALQQQVDNHVENKRRELGEHAGRMIRSVPPSNTNINDSLERTIEGSVEYVYQVNEQLRAPLLKIHNKLETDSDVLRQKLELTRATLQEETVSLQTLVKEAKAIKSHQEAIDGLAERREAFTGQLNDYTAWSNLVVEGNSLSELLNQMGDLVSEQRRDFQNLSRDIRAHLSAHKLDALPDTATYSLRLDALLTSARTIRTNAIRQFTDLQDRYRQALLEALNFPNDQLWSAHQLNPLAPDDSYARLYDDVHKTVQHAIIGRFQKAIDEMQDALRNTLQSPLIKQMPSGDREQVHAQGHELQEQLQRLAQQLTTARNGTSLTVIKGFFQRDDDGFENLLQQLATIRGGISKYKALVNELSQKLQKLSLEGGEQALFSAISGNVEDLGAIRERAQLSEQEFWRALSGLQAKRRVRITIERVADD
ncbi:MAG: hypothetical protein H3C69_07920 [Candidatus Promineofilum sp.]|nr:hypothetical protein [Promineifilum sp.]